MQLNEFSKTHFGICLCQRIWDFSAITFFEFAIKEVLPKKAEQNENRNLGGIKIS